MSSFNILLVDDEPHYRILLNKFLDAYSNLTIIEAENGRDAINQMSKFDFDLIISDVNMPEMDGIEMLDEMNKQEIQIPLIFVTALEDSDQIIEAFKKGAINVLKKPYEIKFVKSVLDKFIDRKLAKMNKPDSANPYLNSVSETYMLSNDFTVISAISNQVIEMMARQSAVTESDSHAVSLAIYEILQNAMLHGNLEISYDDETENYEQGGTTETLIANKLKIEKLAARRVKFHYELNKDSIFIDVMDEGNGFDYNNLPDPTDPKNLFLEHGRGVMMTRLQMTEFQYLGKGNQVQMKRVFGSS